MPVSQEVMKGKTRMLTLNSESNRFASLFSFNPTIAKLESRI